MAGDMKRKLGAEDWPSAAADQIRSYLRHTASAWGEDVDFDSSEETIKAFQEQLRDESEVRGGRRPINDT